MVRIGAGGDPQAEDLGDVDEQGQLDRPGAVLEGLDGGAGRPREVGQCLLGDAQFNAPHRDAPAYACDFSHRILDRPSASPRCRHDPPYACFKNHRLANRRSSADESN